ncbi:MAG: hypothetical protein ACI3ZP_07440 [Candidatus Cryptobacteroides sp.]
MLVCAVILLGLTQICQAGEKDDARFNEAVLVLTGAGEIEELDEYEIDRYLKLSASPLRLNSAGRSALLSSGLMTLYQVVSFLDYRTLSGPVMSFPELASIDGFNERLAEALSLFVVLDNPEIPARREMGGEAMTNVSMKKQPVAEGHNLTACKSRLSLGSEGRFELGLAAGKDYDAPFGRPSSYSGYVNVCRRGWGLVAGDFALRFGQGLALWSGFSMSGFSGERTFWKRATGITPSWSLSGTSSHRGLAAGVQLGKFGISVFASVPGLRRWCESGGKPSLSLMPGVNVALYLRNGVVSATAYGLWDGIGSRTMTSAGPAFGGGKVSADARLCFRGVVLAGEVAWDIMPNKIAACLSTDFPIKGNWRTALAVRHIPEGYDLSLSSPVRTFTGKTGESGISAGLFFRQSLFTADYSLKSSDFGMRQLKLLLSSPFRINDTFSINCRITSRFRSYEKGIRTSLRTDLKYVLGDWNTVARYELLKFKGLAHLAYLEEGFVHGSGAVFLRGTLYFIDSWDDRIYAYERDAPGSFNVPAYYGRGYSLSLVARQKIRFRVLSMKIYWRTGFYAPVWGKVKRDCKFENRLQLSLDF